MIGWILLGALMVISAAWMLLTLQRPTSSHPAASPRRSLSPPGYTAEVISITPSPSFVPPLMALDKLTAPVRPHAEEAALLSEIRALRLGLQIIAARGCERSTAVDCWTNHRTATARYADDLACNPCIAARVLTLQPLP